MKIFVFGNPLVKKDSLPPRLLPKLQKRFPKIKFILADPHEEWSFGEKEVIAMDTVLGIKKTTLFNSLEKFFQKERKVTLHDYDLLLDLKLLKKLGKIKKVRIIGLPAQLGLKETICQMEELLKAI